MSKNYKGKKLSYISNEISRQNFDIVLVHSDSIKTLNLVDISLGFKTINSQHCDNLLSIIDPNKLLIPTFSYEFPKSKYFHMAKTPSQVGSISERFRTYHSKWRSIDPIFSFSGIRPHNINQEIKFDKLNSFGKGTLFDYLGKTKSGILFYGTSIKHATVIHHVEALLEAPYRYKKEISGKLIFQGKEFSIKYSSHFRPKGKSLNYCWDTIENDLIQQNILKKIDRFISYVSIKDLLKFWTTKINQNYLYLLNKESKNWVEPMLNKLGRRFIASDFE